MVESIEIKLGDGATNIWKTALNKIPGNIKESRRRDRIADVVRPRRE
jgi:hypothetical protein